MTIAPMALAKDAIRLTIDQLVVLNPRFSHTGAIYSEKQLLMIPVGINDMIKAAAKTPQPLNFFILHDFSPFVLEEEHVSACRFK